ncbi:MAG: ClpXP protease specificity-enhancing factor [Gammaproteobacteria bacterium]
MGDTDFSDGDDMSSTRPYLLRAIYQWIVDNGLTPLILVDATLPGVEVPGDFVDDGRIILNISPGAVRDLDLGDEIVGFNARFGGTPWQIWVPLPAVQAVYARENGRGMVFAEEEGDPPPTSPEPDTGRNGKSSGDDNRPRLRVVK